MSRLLIIQIMTDPKIFSKNPEFVEAVCRQNILNTIKMIRAKSPIFMEMGKIGEIKVVGAEYHMGTGRVDFF